MESGFQLKGKEGKLLNILREEIDKEYAQSDSSEKELKFSKLKFLERRYARQLQKLQEEDLENAEIITAASMPVSKIQKILDNQTAIIEYYSTDKKLIIFCITGKGMNCVEVQVSRKDMEKMVNALKLWIFGIEDSCSGEEKKLKEESLDWYISEISKMLFLPVEEFVKDCRRIIVIPHLTLHYLPFALLVGSDNKKIIEKYEIANIPSPKLIKKRPAVSSKKASNALIIANPLGDLKFADTEAESISGIFPAAKILKGQNAEKDAILKLIPEYSVLHFACHAKINTVKPLFSELIVAGKNGCKARIELNEIFNTKNNAELVVLSGCETGIGDITPGDEITCFPRAFMYSGAASVLVSLWEIDDNSTAEFMKKFYEELFVNKKSKSEALQSAQFYMISKGYSPYHWAGFQLVGN